MAILTTHNSPSPSQPWDGSPQERRPKNRTRRPRNNRNQRCQGGRPRSDSESEASESSDQSTLEVYAATRRQKKGFGLDHSRFVALDCEMVGVGFCGKRSALARVTLIDWNGTVLLDEYVQQTEEVTDYRTFVSGITASDLEEAKLDMESCRATVLALLEGKVLVGHGLKNDLRVLSISHPWHMTRDTAKYEPFMKVRFQDGILWPRGLRELCKEKLDRDVQTHGGPHCPYEDALAALDLYKHVQHKWEKAMDYKVKKTRAIEQQKFLQAAKTARE